MKPGTTILIIPSVALSELKLDALVGVTATVVEVSGTFDNIKGCWVKLPGKYLGESEWWIPAESFVT